MEDPDLIACIYPVANAKTTEKFFKKNNDRFQQGLPQVLPETPEPESVPRDWASTRGPSEVEDNNDPDDYLDCLELRFSNPPKTDRGFVFGFNPKCDVVLPPLPGISNFHFTLTFENDFYDTNNYRLVLKDLGSRAGTIVGYSGAGMYPRRRFRWILSGHRDVEGATLMVDLHKTFMLRIAVFVSKISNTHSLCSKVHEFLRPRSPSSHLGDLDLGSALRTWLTTGEHTPEPGPILIDMTELGRGAFAITTRAWDVSTGQTIARKRARDRLTPKQVAEWRREAELLGRLSHDHIVRLYEVFELPGGQIELHLEPVLGGTLRPRLPLPYSQGLEVIRQSLSALAYLHEQTPPIVHRDIKPENILVDDTPAGMRIKLADFGFSREDLSLVTLCGTPLYFPPEMWEEQSSRDDGGPMQRYSSAVDIWSLGVVAAQCVHDLPTCIQRGLPWCKKVVKHVAMLSACQLYQSFHRFLLSHMIILDPKARASARECHDEVAELLRLSGDRYDLDMDMVGGIEGYGTPVSLEEYEDGDEEEYDEKDEEDTVGVWTLRPARSRADDRRSRRAAPYPPRAGVRDSGSQRSARLFSTATVGPHRITRPTLRGVASGTVGNRSIRAARTSTHSFSTSGTEEYEIGDEDHPMGTEEHEDGDEDLPMGAESGYFAHNWLLDPLMVGSSVARMGREDIDEEWELGSNTTVKAGSGATPQVRPPHNAPHTRNAAGTESSVVILDDAWLQRGQQQWENAGMTDFGSRPAPDPDRELTASERELLNALDEELDLLAQQNGGSAF